MSELNFEPLPSMVQPPAGKKSVIIAWAIILLVAGFIIVGNSYPELRGRHKVAASEQLQMTLLGKYTLGVARWMPASAPQLFSQIEQKATTPESKLDAAILAGEMVGKDAALKRIDELLDSHAPETLKVDARSVRHIYEADSATTQSAAEPFNEDHGFYGRLAQAFGKSDADPQRAAVLHEAAVAAVAYIAFLIVGGLLLVLGLVLLIVGVVLLSTHYLKCFYMPARGASPVFVEIFAVYLLSFVLIGVLIHFLLPNASGMGATWLATPVLPLAIGWGWYRGLSWADIRNGLGWHRGRGWLIEIPLGVVGYITGLPIVGLGLCVSLFLVWLTGAKPGHPIQNELATTPAWQLYLIAAVWAPIVEETMFRGALFHHMRRRWSWLVSAGTIALLFASIHPQGLSFIPVLGAIAIVLAGIREWRGTLIPSVVAHGLNNATIVTLMLLTM